MMSLSWHNSGISTLFGRVSLERVLSDAKTWIASLHQPRTNTAGQAGKSGVSFVPPVGERGAQLVEFALTVPIALIVLTGLLSFGVYLNKSLELTNSTSLAGQYLAINRGTTAAADPCALFVSAFQNVSPYEAPATSSYSFVLTNATYTGSYTGTSCTSLAVGMTQGASATIKVTYPCTLGIYGVQLAPGCLLTSQVTEIIQ
jgi:hypothetical protein